ncbi:MAG TPA: PAS domain-containing protein [Geodermatophilus sp.]|nr:PAS domain-containing protein [Geodermatophilus sp.]
MLDIHHRPGPRGAGRGVAPTGEARTFAPDELIVSKTDLRGVITYANDVFLRISRYELDEVLGRPHNLIRHPEMPRAVFALLWQTLSEGRELFAYINNLASDGAHYWVLAHVTPSYSADGAVIGYHSNRRRPSPGAIRTVTPLYRRLVEEERRHPTAKAAVAASSRLLDELVAAEAGSYEEFIWSVIAREER